MRIAGVWDAAKWAHSAQSFTAERDLQSYATSLCNERRAADVDTNRRLVHRYHPDHIQRIFSEQQREPRRRLLQRTSCARAAVLAPVFYKLHVENQHGGTCQL